MAAAMGLGTIAKGLSIGAATGLAAFSVKKLSTNDHFATSYHLSVQWVKTELLIRRDLRSEI